MNIDFTSTTLVMGFVTDVTDIFLSLMSEKTGKKVVVIDTLMFSLKYRSRVTYEGKDEWYESHVAKIMDAKSEAGMYKLNNRMFQHNAVLENLTSRKRKIRRNYSRKQQH